jgi:hypothetical protein
VCAFVHQSTSKRQAQTIGTARDEKASFAEFKVHRNILGISGVRIESAVRRLFVPSQEVMKNRLSTRDHLTIGRRVEKPSRRVYA